MATQDYKFEGWVAHDKTATEGNMTWAEFEPKRWEETDIDIKVECCGMCFTDVSTLRSGWYEAPYPIVVGHEIVGRIVRVGSKAVGNHAVGDRVGVGCLSDNCESVQPTPCRACGHGEQSYCARAVWTYPGFHHNGDKGYGGYASHHRCPGRFAFKIPEKLASSNAATLMCAGITMYAPLRRHGCGPGKTVGIIGLGGLGHYGVLFAKALGADKVVAVSRRPEKRDEALALGADLYIATEEAGWQEEHSGTLDLVINTVTSVTAPLAGYLKLLAFRGRLVQVGHPEDGVLPIHPGSLLGKQASVEGSSIGSSSEIKEMLDLAAEKGIKGWIEERPMADANKAIVELEAGKPRYRYCLVNKD